MKANHTKKRKNIEHEKKLSGLKNMYFNRYLMIRYTLALCLFSNFYWALFTKGHWIMMFPIAMLILAIPPCFENIRSYGEKSITMKWTKFYYQVQLFITTLLLFSIWTPVANKVLPMLNDTMLSRSVTSGMVFVGWILAFACLKRLFKIATNTDKHYMRIQQYEKILHLHL